MNPVQFIQKTINIEDVDFKEEIQSLWSGYGQIERYLVSDENYNSVILKHIKWPNQNKHPRGWNTGLSHKRKVKSYEVEVNFYQKFAKSCDDSCKIPHCFGSIDNKEEIFLLLQDLDALGFDKRFNFIDYEKIKDCLYWLANFHATFMGVEPDGLWKVGTYWHLDTRPDELNVLSDLSLKKVASKLDLILKKCRFKTLVHGDAKLANFCFHSSRNEVAAVDFQYVGSGCGMKDLAYFVGSCLNEEESEHWQDDILNIYFEYLTDALNKSQSKYSSYEIETEWRSLYKIAWTDFHRFIKGWSPGHYKINSYSERLAREVIKELNERNE